MGIDRKLSYNLQDIMLRKKKNPVLQDLIVFSWQTKVRSIALGCVYIRNCLCGIPKAFSFDECVRKS